MSESSNAYDALMLKAATDEAFRQALLEAPKATLAAHLGATLPEDFKVSVVENTPTEITLAIPPLMTETLSDEDLDSVSGGTKKVLDGFSMSVGLFIVGCIYSAAADMDACRKFYDKYLATKRHPMDTSKG